MSMPDRPGGRVLTVHGWAMTGMVTQYWNKRLRLAGFQPRSFSYRSRRLTLDANAEVLAGEVAALMRQPDGAGVHLVGHSLGGLLIMHCLARHPMLRPARVVLVGSPFQGSAAGRRLGEGRAGRWLLGNCIVQWHGVEAAQLPAALEVGTIAGSKPWGAGCLLGGLKTPHDGTVSVAETCVPFACDRIVLPVTHTGMLMSPAVTRQIEEFLRRGKFFHD